jgi:hypothetical protein
LHRPTTGTTFRLTALVAVLLSAGGCALAVRHVSVADVRQHPDRYYGRMVEVRGRVTSAWGVSVAPVAIYRIDDGTGELTVVAQGGLIPTRGSRVEVRGRVSDVATVGGQAVGLHLRQERLRVRGP